MSASRRSRFCRSSGSVSRSQLQLVDVDQLVPLLAQAVQRLQHLGHLVLHGPARQQPLERRAGLAVAAGWRSGCPGRPRPPAADRRCASSCSWASRKFRLDDLLVGVGQADLGRAAPRPARGQRSAAGVQAIERQQPLGPIGLDVGHPPVGGDGLVGLAQSPPRRCAPPAAGSRPAAGCRGCWRSSASYTAASSGHFTVASASRSRWAITSALVGSRRQRPGVGVEGAPRGSTSRRSWMSAILVSSSIRRGGSSLCW